MPAGTGGGRDLAAVKGGEKLDDKKIQRAIKAAIESIPVDFDRIQRILTIIVSRFSQKG